MSSRAPITIRAMSAPVKARDDEVVDDDGVTAAEDDDVDTFPVGTAEVPEVVTWHAVPVMVKFHVAVSVLVWPTAEDGAEPFAVITTTWPTLTVPWLTPSTLSVPVEALQAPVVCAVSVMQPAEFAVTVPPVETVTVAPGVNPQIVWETGPPGMGMELETVFTSGGYAAAEAKDTAPGPTRARTIATAAAALKRIILRIYHDPSLTVPNRRRPGAVVPKRPR